MNGYGAFPGDGSDNRGGGVHPGGRGDGVLSGSDLRRRPFPPPEYGLAFGGNREGSAFDDHRGHGAGGGGDDRGGNFDHRSRLGYPPHHENDHDEDNRGPTRFGGVYEDGFGGGSTRNRLPQPQPSYDARTFGGASMMMQERTARQQGGNGSDSGLYGNGGAGGDGRGEPVSFGCDNFQDPLDKDRPPPQHPHDDGGGATKPGVQFCSSHDAVSAKIAASDGKGGVPAAHHPQIEIAPGIMARLRGAKETWECGKRNAVVKSCIERVLQPLSNLLTPTLPFFTSHSLHQWRTTSTSPSRVSAVPRTSCASWTPITSCVRRARW